MKSLVVGLSFGQLYKDVLLKMGHQVITVDNDPNKQADFLELTTALATHSPFDTAHICVPNHLHYKTAQKVAPCANMVFVEKPGVESTNHWRLLNSLHKPTKFMMTKNNMFRDNIDQMQQSVDASDLVQINWINKNRIPGPGTWFTNKKYALGGVSKDLLPHLLSLFVQLSNGKYKDYKVEKFDKDQRWSLNDCVGTEYGEVNKDGVYDVDDEAEITLSNGEKTFILKTMWKSNMHDDVAMHFYKDGESHLESIQLGLCPESAYEQMIRSSIVHKDDDAFWNKQLDYDLWIQELINERSIDTVH